jgi:hypothetical protein
MLIFVEEGKPEDPEKNPQSKGQNPQTTHMKYLSQKRTHAHRDHSVGRRAYYLSATQSKVQIKTGRGCGL